MKRFLMLIAALLLVMGLTACGNRKDPTESSSGTNPSEMEGSEPNVSGTDEKQAVLPSGTVIYRVEVGGMTQEAAQKVLKDAIASYCLTLTAHGEEIALSGSDLGISVSQENLSDFFREAEQGKTPDGENVILFETASAVDKVCEFFSVYASNADVKYRGWEERFVAISEQAGKGVDRDLAAEIINRAVKERSTHADISEACYSWGPEVCEGDPRVKNAIDAANHYLQTDLIYTFTPDGGQTREQTLEKDDLACFIYIDDDYSVDISMSAINDYVDDLADIYGENSTQKDFLTTGGGTVSYQVDYYGQGLDREALAEDIYDCIVAGRSGTREAPYLEKGPGTDLPYGGNYLEISLTDQHLWVYSDGECVVSTPIVSGCVANGDQTPTGVYEVTDLDTDCWLVGPTWNDYVNYWIGFSGTYGIHDASWRSEFGGEIYIYEGSHGCANLPVSVAGAVYQNAPVGTKVIIYGGKSKAEPLQQVISGTEVYDVADDAEPFKLDASLKYEGTSLIYQSDNTAVAEVSGDGSVFVKTPGEAHITVSAKKFAHYTGAKLKVTMKVHSACEEGRHRFGDWEQTVSPSCVPGEETRTCSGCGKKETRELPATASHTPGEWEIVEEPGCETPGLRRTVCTVCGKILEEEVPATGHDFSPDAPYCKNGCGTPNPDYAAPPARKKQKYEA